MADDYSDAIDDVLGPGNGPAAAVGSSNDNPDKAARAMNLSAATGVPAPVIHADLDNFEDQHKAAVGADIVRNNPQISGLIQSHPLAGAVTNDDLANLDTVSQHASTVAQPSVWQRLADGYHAAKESVLDYTNSQQNRDEEDRLYNYVDSPSWRMFAGGLVAGMRTVNQAMAIPSAAIEGVVAATGADDRLRGDLNTLVFAAGDPALHAAHPTEEQNSIAFAAKRSQDVARPYIEAGKPPPVGIDPIIDAGHLAQNHIDIAALNDALAASFDSNTRARAPNMFSDFIRQHTGESYGISHDAVRELYGSKVPEPDDGLLGFIPDLPSQLLRSSVTGADIQVPIADYMTGIDPQVHNQLEPFIRTREGGITQAEADKLAQPDGTVTAYHGTSREYDEFNPSADTTKGGRSPIENGVSFFADTPEATQRYGDRTLRAEIDPGRTAEYNLTDLYNNDPSFLDRIVQAARGDNADRGLSDAAEADARDQHAKYLANEASRQQAIEAEGGTYPGPDKVSNRSGARQAAIAMAREQGLDTVRLTGLREGDQLAVLNPENIRRLTDQDREIKVLRQRAGLDRPRHGEEPMLEYQLDPNNPNYHFVENGRGRIGLEMHEDGQGGWFGKYADVGEGEGTSKVIRDLSSVAGGDETLTGSAKMMADVLDHIGAGNVPTYTVTAQNPAVRGNLGTYFPSSDAIALRHTGNAEQMLQTAIHEGAHAAFHYVLDNDPEVRTVAELLLHESRLNDMSQGGRYSFPFDGMNVPTEHYGNTNIHEFFSELTSNNTFREHLMNSEPSQRAAEALNAYLGRAPESRIANLWEAFLQLARKAFGLPDTPANRTLLDFSMRVADRATRSAEAENDRANLSQMGVQFDQPLPPDPIFDRAAALGMNRAQAVRYRDLILKQESADFEARKAAILRDEERRQTAEWKANAVEMRKEVAPDISNRPDVKADAILRGGAKLDTDALTSEQRAALGEDHTRGGLNPDDLAQNVGFDTGDEMISALSQYREARGVMRNQDYVRQLISNETDRRMEERYGNSRQNILDAARDRVLSEGQFDILQAEAEAAAGGKVPFTKAGLKENVKATVGETPMGQVNSEAAISAAGRAASAIEDNLLKNDPKEAFVQRMRQYNALLAAKEMGRIEKLRDRFDDKMATYRKREIAGASQEYVNQIHDLMVKLGYPVNRSLQDIRENIDKNGYDSFDHFVRTKEGADGDPRFRQDLHVPEWLRDPNFSKKVDELTASEFEQLNKAMTALVHNARNEHKVTIGGIKFDYAETRDGLIQQLKEVLPGSKKPKSLDNPNSAGTIAKSYWWSSINLESMLNRFDRDDPLGKFNQTLTRMFTEAAGDRERMLIDYNRRMRELGDFGDIDKAVKNDLFVDQADGQAFDMKRRHVLGVLQNVGNEGNMRKLAGGYKIQPLDVMEFLRKNTTVEDWDRAQKIGDVFEELFNKADDMSHNVSGVGIEKIPLKPFTDPFGVERRGWYNPVAYDQLRGEKSGRAGSMDDLDTGFYRATTPQTYTKTRTGYIGQMQLNLDIVPTRMKQMIHDITTREAVQQLGKFFYDPVFRNAIRDHYGMAQMKSLEPFLRDFANAPNFESEAARNQNRLIGGMSSNMVVTSIGLNPGTVMKHGFGALQKSLLQQPIGFTKALTKVLTSPAEWQRALELSDECKRRMRNFEDTVTNAGQDITLRGSGEGSHWKTAKAFAQYIYGWPIGAFDMLSSVPTFLATYDRAIAAGEDVGQAKFLADRDVRQTHGSSLLTNRPEIARSKNALARTFAGFYGVFSENLQKQYQTAWMLKDAYGLAKEGDFSGVGKAVPKIAGTIFTSMIMMSVIEHAVDSNDETKKESWAQYAGDILFKSATSSLIGFRDLGNSLTSGRDPGGNLLSSYEKALVDPVKDVYHAMLKHDIREVWSPQKAGKFLKNISIMTGALTGLTNAQEGRLAQFGYNYMQGREHPRTGVEFATGAWHGTLKNHRR